MLDDLMMQEKSRLSGVQFFEESIICRFLLKIIKCMALVGFHNTLSKNHNKRKERTTKFFPVGFSVLFFDNFAVFYQSMNMPPIQGIGPSNNLG